MGNCIFFCEYEYKEEHQTLDMYIVGWKCTILYELVESSEEFWVSLGGGPGSRMFYAWHERILLLCFVE
jgi:hypothetical protein